MRWLSVVLPFLFACTSITSTGPVEVRVLGAIAGYGVGDPHIEIQGGPGSAWVQVTTYGGGCHRKGEMEVEVDGMAAQIWPYDYVLVQAGMVCADILHVFTHDVTVDFGGSGEARITIRGTDIQGEEIRVQRVVRID